MKKGAIFLLILSISSVAFMAGFFLGRNLGRSDIQLQYPASATTAATDGSAPESTAAEAEPSGPVNINTATLEQLQTLPGIGPVLAQSILDYREEHGAFSSVEELASVSGIGVKRLEAILDYVTIGG